MSVDEQAFARLQAKSDIRELAELYARGSDRKDMALLRTLYTESARHVHGDYFDGAAKDFLDGWEKGMQNRTGAAAHYICNHLISVDGEEGEGEVLGLAWHLIGENNGVLIEDFVGVRYFDSYRKEGGLWRFAQRSATIDFRLERTVDGADRTIGEPAGDASYKALTSRLFARGGPR
jgi:hypothetical protein